MQKPAERPYAMSESFANTIRTIMSLYRDTLEHEEWRKKNSTNSVINLDYYRLLEVLGIVPERKSKASSLLIKKTNSKGKVIPFVVKAGGLS